MLEVRIIMVDSLPMWLFFVSLLVCLINQLPPWDQRQTHHLLLTWTEWVEDENTRFDLLDLLGVFIWGKITPIISLKFCPTRRHGMAPLWDRLSSANYSDFTPEHNFWGYCSYFRPKLPLVPKCLRSEKGRTRALQCESVSKSKFSQEEGFFCKRRTGFARK